MSAVKNDAGECEVWTGRSFYTFQNLLNFLKKWLNCNPFLKEAKDSKIIRELGLNQGSYLNGGRDCYCVLQPLGEGSFGAVLEVEALTTSEVLAAKIEKCVKGRRSKLKMEWKILQTVRAGNDAGLQHFVSALDYNSFLDFRFFVMTKLGKSLADLKSARMKQFFSLATALGACIQCMQAIQIVHRHGFIHRDIKPSNYAVGLHEDERMIYILDFGIARKITKLNGDLKEPRHYVSFHGTVRYASRSAHRNIELGFGDDCESWLYMFYDLTTGLPWRSLSKRDKVLAKKVKYMENDPQKLPNKYSCSNELRILTIYIAGLTYTDVVDYEYIYALVKEAANVSDVDLDKPYDWEKYCKDRPDVIL